MSTFSNLIKHRNILLDNINRLSLDFEIQNKISLLQELKYGADDSHVSILSAYQLRYENLIEQSQNIINDLYISIEDIDREIDQLAKTLFDSTEYKNKFIELSRILPENESNLETKVINQITKLSDWRYPALQINPTMKRWIDYMVAGDPLYLTHFNFSDMQKLVDTYPEIYQRRLRLYEITNRNFSLLPQEQFGLVLCWNTFNYLSDEKIEHYLNEVFKLLRPGGTFIFNYNNCDLELSAINAENHFESYSTARKMKQIGESIGYQIELIDILTDNLELNNKHLSYGKFQKPGILQTVKASQALAQICSK